MAGIDELPYRDPREALRESVLGRSPPVAQAQPVADPIPVGDARERELVKLQRTPTSTPGRSPEFQAAQRSLSGGIGQPPTPAAVAPTAAPQTGIGAMPAQAAPKGGMYRVGNAAAKVVKGAVPAAIGAGVVSDFNNYKINDPGVDSSAAGTFNAVRAGDFAGAAKSASKGALETLMDLGSTVANAADYVVPGKAPVSTAYNAMLKNTFGDQLVDNTAKPAEAPAAAPVAAQPAQTGIGAMPTKQVQAAAVPAPTSPATPAPTSVTFDPKAKSFSGTDVREGFDYAGGVRPAGLTPEQGGGGLKGGGTVSSLDTSEGFRQNQMEAQRLVAERLDREAAMPGNQPGGGLGGINGKPFGYRVEPGTATYTPEGATQESAVSRIRDLTNTGGLSPSQAVQAVSQEDSRAEQRRTSDQNAQLSRRSQDIGVMSQQAGNRTQRDIATIQGNTQRDVAGMNSDARVDAALQRSGRPLLVGGGQVPYIDPQTGETKMRAMPARVFDPQTKTYLDKEAAAADQVVPKIATDPRAIAIKNDPNMSDAEKRKQLQALGYK